MTLEELQIKFNDSKAKVEKRLALTKKAIKNEGVSEDILEDFYKLITDSNGKIDGNKSLQQLKEKYFPEAIGSYLYSNEVTENLYKLRDLMATNFNWKVKLDKAVNEENEEKIEVIWNFLQQWRVNARKWCMDESAKYVELKKSYDEKWNEYKETDKYKEAMKYAKVYAGDYYIQRAFDKEYYGSVTQLIKDITRISYHRENYYDEKSPKIWTVRVDEELLDKTLDKDVKAKYKDLINRITAVIGTIKDATHLSIGPKGDINGIIIGSEGKANIETIGAGGYNIQCFHFRTLIHKIK